MHMHSPETISFTLLAYWNDSITQLVQICWEFYHIPKGVLLDSDLATVKAIQVQQTNCHDEETKAFVNFGPNFLFQFWQEWHPV